MEPRAHTVSRCSEVERHPDNSIFLTSPVRETGGHLLGKVKCFKE